MPRHRLTRALLLLAGLGVVTYLLISLYLPSSRWLVFGVDKHTGVVRVVQQTITFLPPHQFFRLKFERREGFAQRDGIIRITSKDGVPVTVNYRLRFGITGDRLPDARLMVDEGWNAWIRARVAEAVSAVTQQISIEDLLSPNSQFNSQRGPLRQTVANHLARSGLKVTAFEVARFEADRDALLRVKRAELRRDARSAPTRVVIFALDGADWELLHELADDGRIPNLKALATGGTAASLQTIQPTVSPMVWTTVATGLTPDRHGVIDFTERSHRAPVDSYSRRVPAVWDIADSFGRQSLVAGWWSAWPPTAPDSIFYDTPVEELTNAVYPSALTDRAASLAVPVETVGYEQSRRFLNISPTEWDNAVNGKNPADPVVIFRSILAKTWNDHRVAINLYNDQRQHGQDPMLVMVSYEGTDAVNHLFAPFHPPYREGISQESYRKFWPTVANYYAEVDRLIGEWMGVLPRDTTVMIMSSYGFRWGKNRPRTMPNGGAALSDHRNPGMFVAYGPHVAPNRGNHPMSVYDVAPTVLTLLGLPQSIEMPGHVATWMFRDVAPITSVRVVSYGEFVNNKPVPVAIRLDQGPYAQELQAIGHLNDPSRNLTPVLEDQDQSTPPRAAAPLSPDRWGQYAYYNNLGVQLRAKAKLSDAVDAFDRAIDINPSRPTPHLNEAITMFDRQQYTAADDQFLQAVSLGLPNAESYFIDFAALYRLHNMNARAIALLYQGRKLFPQSYLIAANLGSALVAGQRYTEGVPELVRALGLQPSSTLALNNLGLFYAKQNDYGRALDFWNRSLSIEPHQPQIREAAVAARSRL
jgi:predicted AlkP superfamily phosphohydrolase/phosphomutase/Tfp pilus assembly protein PilF